MKQIISRLKNISMMLIWDVITAIALFVFAYFSLDRMPSTMYKVLVLCGVALFVIIMFVIKYQLLYKKYGRDDVTGGKNKKRNSSGSPEICFAGMEIMLSCTRTSTVLS